ncbi:type IV secretion system protein VirB4 [Variovorax boronicumulans]|uniref:VirB4 family type IV secretion/conjugal transfer ATPase n=1 Tax=Variovorax boronicumulans TaxID=436515 RepID=UPI00278311CF|nr:VirB4 family type IV secretion/conjugal transfer ATPase [Variovorax boronicumulans]MDP9995274.1 type IV secretion system protein VirB4 [Variovorax boronicumulans]MDQ0006564.1 type IV secretion system protein VirB4 [Variovorax boronicumulans]
MKLLSRSEHALRREAVAAAMIPLSAHVDAHVARTRAGDYVQTLRLAGASFESADDDDINSWQERLNVLLRNIASPNLALWTHVIRRRETGYPAGRTVPGFADEIEQRYRRKMAGERLMVNELYLSVVFRPQPTRIGNAALRLFRRADPEGAQAELRDALDACAKLRQELLAALERYDPEPLGIYRLRGEHALFSSLVEFHGLLVNGEWQRMPLPRSPLNEVLATSRPFFGNEAMEYRSGTQTRIGAFLGIKEYPTPTAPGMFSALLTAPFPFVLTQSFTFLAKGTATDMMSRQHHRMAAAGDLAVSQAEELKDALDDLMSNRFVVGDHHFSLHVLADTYDGVGEADGPPRLKQLNDNVARARYLLGDTGMVVAREDLALEAAFWAQLPGNFGYRSRKAPVTSRNFAAMSPFHNFPTGRATGNYWGDALAMFMTRAGSPYYFSLHASDPRSPDGGSRRDVGHITGVGPVGTGKTTLLGFCMVSICNRLDATQVIFDKDEGLHILVRALGGRYLSLKNGEPTGCNPLQLDAAVANNVEFMRLWLRRLVMRTPNDTLSVRQEDDLDQALHGTLKLDPSFRRLSRLVAFLDITDPEGMHARLRRWCASERGDYAWVFDNDRDDVAPLLARHALVGFDVTDFLDNEVVRAPLTMYLFHLVNRMVDGRPLVCWMDEFAKLLSDPAFAKFAKNGLETWRKKNANIATFTQSTSHVLDSGIARAIVEQTPTKILFPNPEADYDEYTQGFNLTDREFALIKQELEPGSRQFLIKQNNVSVVAQLDLQGFEDALHVISGRTSNVRLMRECIATFGPGPERWLPPFRKALADRPSRSHSHQENSHA